MAGTPSPLRRVAPHLLGPPLPPLSALWAANRRRALSAAFCVAAPLALGLALGHPGPGSAAALGGFTAVYGHALPYRRRAGVSAGAALAVVASVALGGLTGGHPVVLALTLGLIAAAATAGTAVWRVGPPGALPPVLVAGSASALGSGAGAVGQHVAAAAAAAVLSWLVVMLPWAWDPAGPERRALQAADAAVTRAGSGAAGSRGAVARAVRVAVTAAAGGSRRRPSLLPAADDVEARFFRALPPADAAVDPAVVALVPASRPRTPLWTETAARIGLGVAIAGLVAVAVDLPSPYWAATSAVAVLLGTDARHTRARAAHRVTGTLAGTGIAAVVFAVQPPTAVTVALVAVLLVCVELLIAAQYVLAVTCLTPVSLLLVHLGAPGAAGTTLIAARVEETVLGMAVALAVGLLLFRRAGSRRLPHAVGRTAGRAVAAVQAPAGAPAERELHDELVALADVATAARAELFSARGTDAWLQRSRQVADLGWALLGARARADAVLADAVADRVRRDLGQSSMTSRP
ncbi:FUSC family protein [Modestobacter muralis]|uniref:FUSC family protein n=1 Tax=Modestobacter muralis TaxID=1608614 RepID=A0A6P0EYH4_9ACTN|nr:FUSC family protein [Modestobacter muralis]NEN51216.1 FUSC family protein [Modestobacter muralis]